MIHAFIFLEELHDVTHQLNGFDITPEEGDQFIGMFEEEKKYS